METCDREATTIAMNSLTNIPVIHLEFLLSIYATKFYRHRSPGYQRWNSARRRSKNPVKIKVIALVIYTIFIAEKKQKKSYYACLICKGKLLNMEQERIHLIFR